MAQVYLAELSTLGGFRRKVALKIVKSEFARDPKFAQLMAREAMIGSRLQHPNIVETLEFNEADGRMFLALEFVEGETVEELLSQTANDGRSGLPLDLALEITIQVLKGLSYAHNLVSPEGEIMGIIHRDLKPGNIMVSRHGSVKVMDFGIAKAKVACATITAAGQVRGTPIYMAPEQVTGKALDGRCDQFATATVLYELVTGEQLFIARNLIDIMRRVARADVGDGVRKLDRRQPGIGAIVERMWSVSSDGRYADCMDAARALEDLLPEVRHRMANPPPDDTIDTLPPVSEDEEPTTPNRRGEPPPTRDVPAHADEDEDEESAGGWLGSLFRRKEKKPEPKKKRRKKRRRRDDSGRMASPGQRRRQGESGDVAPPRRRRKKKRRGSVAGAQSPETSSQPIPPPKAPEPPAPEPEDESTEAAPKVAQLGPAPAEPAPEPEPEAKPEPAPEPEPEAKPEPEPEPEPEPAPETKPEPEPEAELESEAKPEPEDEPSFEGPLRPEPALAAASMSFPPGRPAARGGDTDSISMIWEETTFGESTESRGVAPVVDDAEAEADADADADAEAEAEPEPEARTEAERRPGSALEDEPTADGFEVQSSPLMRKLAGADAAVDLNPPSPPADPAVDEPEDEPSTVADTTAPGLSQLDEGAIDLGGPTQPQTPIGNKAKVDLGGPTEPRVHTVDSEERPRGSTQVTWERPTAGLRGDDNSEDGDDAPMDSFFSGDESEDEDDGDSEPMDSFFFED